MVTQTVVKDAPIARISDADMSVGRVVALVDELIAVVEEENRNLARGMPASQSNATARKTALAEDVERWAMHVSRHDLGKAVADHAMRDRLVERVRCLNGLMDENVARLRQAIAASQRRVDAIMRAVREDMASRAVYGRSGRVDSPRTASGWCGKGIRA